MDCTEIFSKAVELKNEYCFKEIKKRIDSSGVFHCGDWDEWADDNWHMLTPEWTEGRKFECYGYLCAEYPVALLTEVCPESLKCELYNSGIVFAELDEPLSCDEKILQKYVPHHIVFDESFMDNGDFSFDDERFFWICQKLDTGHQDYIDAGCFTMKEIR
ncbi:MAG: hypothetical protein K5979_06940 [Ruminococcus sp.]|nr:hypothetical protein [Ruminococcus sp.]